MCTVINAFSDHKVSGRPYAGISRGYRSVVASWTARRVCRAHLSHQFTVQFALRYHYSLYSQSHRLLARSRNPPEVFWTTHCRLPESRLGSDNDHDDDDDDAIRGRRRFTSARFINCCISGRSSLKLQWHEGTLSTRFILTVSSLSRKAKLYKCVHVKVLTLCRHDENIHTRKRSNYNALQLEATRRHASHTGL